VRSQKSQVATVPEPLKLHGWQLLDEFNRAFAHQPPSGYVTPAHLVTKDNIDADGGKNNEFDPGNDYQSHYKAIWGVK
jgi:ribose transport system substrate-binding protein